jgi:pimeloyl-ACP methyl ester carboxylesterase
MYFNKSNNLTKIISTIALFVLILGVSLLNPSFTYALVEEKEQQEKLQNITVNPLLLSSPSSFKPLVLDPNPSLIDEDGNLINNISLAASIKTNRTGTTADGISKLILVIKDNKALQFSIEGRNSTDIIDGRLSHLDQTNVNSLSSDITVSPQNISNGESVVAAVYTPPDSFNQDKGSNRTININVNASNPNDRSVSIQLYRPPVVLVHGLWTNSEETWIMTNFNKTLVEHGFNPAFADYKEHNSETFDPYAIKTMDGKPFGNYGIDSIRNEIHRILREYHNNSIAASQVDIVGYSMGGLMARGFVQQLDYKDLDNFMKGSIHRLITIGTPHYGGHMARFIYNHTEDFYCWDGKSIKPPDNCKDPMQLKTIYRENFSAPIDEGGIESLIPNSTAYSRLCQTPVSSYAIAGNWKPNAILSHNDTQKFYRDITKNSTFRIDEDGFHGDNDLAVNITSQLGGLQNQIRQADGTDIPNESSVYKNTVHSSRYVKDMNISWETKSPHIQEDVTKLLSSSDNNKFADAIGIGSPCIVPKQTQ